MNSSNVIRMIRSELIDPGQGFRYWCTTDILQEPTLGDLRDTYDLVIEKCDQTFWCALQEKSGSEYSILQACIDFCLAGQGLNYQFEETKIITIFQSSAQKFSSHYPTFHKDIFLYKAASASVPFLLSCDRQSRIPVTFKISGHYNELLPGWNNYTTCNTS